MCTRHPRFLLYWRLKLSKSVRPVCMTVCNYRVSHTYLWIHRGEKRKTCNHDSIRRERERDREIIQQKNKDKAANQLGCSN